MILKRSLALPIGILIGIVGSTTRSTRAERPEPFGVADIPSYLSALQRTTRVPPRRVGFRDLWERPETLRGKAVSIDGRLVARFRATASGRLPSRTELWIDAGSGNLVCLVHPAHGSSPTSEAKIGDPIRFEGTFLRMIPYQGGDVPRIAPLVVGPRAAETTPSDRKSRPTLDPKSESWDWMIGLGVGGFVIIVILGSALGSRRSRPSAIERTSEAPTFLDGPIEPTGPTRIERSRPS